MFSEHLFRDLFVSRKMVSAVADEVSGLAKITYQDGYKSSCPADTFQRDYVRVGFFYDPIEGLDAETMALLSEAALLRNESEEIGIKIRTGEIDRLVNATMYRLMYVQKLDLLSTIESLLMSKGITPQCRHVRLMMAAKSLVDEGRSEETIEGLLPYVGTVEVIRNGVRQTVLNSQIVEGDEMEVTRCESTFKEVVVSATVVYRPIQ